MQAQQQNRFAFPCDPTNSSPHVSHLQVGLATPLFALRFFPIWLALAQATEQNRGFRFFMTDARRSNRSPHCLHFLLVRRDEIFFISLVSLMT